MSATWYFCRNRACSYNRGLFDAKPEDKLACPKCYEPMVRQDTAWAHRDGSLDVQMEPKDAA